MHVAVASHNPQVPALRIVQVAWTLLKSVRNEDNMYEQFVRTTAILQHHYSKSCAELACAERSKLTVSPRLTKVRKEKGTDDVAS